MSNHFSNLTPEQHERLAIFFEECGEVASVAIRLFSDMVDDDIAPKDSQYHQEFTKEVGDLMLATELIESLGDIDTELVQERYNHLESLKNSLIGTDYGPVYGTKELIADCSEAARVCGRIFRHALNSYHPVTNESNRQLLSWACGNIASNIDLLIKCGVLDKQALQTHSENKRIQLRKWTHSNIWG